uniref:Uncharacterized protein n=1 Tax=Mucochytrium quahogii TaxID=96639 RepID=A0A7S2SMV6_9STRA|mmetsp:Transcript_5864/g.9108  ORF Transcript_5864/g.9108 Transcript_5864/m.9108 type:complete len:637 (+) Transcript_5864:354-2264(+)|eukprot:CAMPEP_0203766740 /NCGR_PEP_ID=MMETSP0099_2-20121227/592_1 /ASSEMBLY_ACC=CAM_ASM_000209 /TAXON_ID=96639 /ORGANISM=" , Strain NY0313808BC1" /LENGTH=636 /DNA_ID=CAMNT_0050663137 /DNA_START=301 /DNA_END=2211 /DNA_ORIENTATION=-
MGELGFVDFFVIALYFVLLFCFSALVSRHQLRAQSAFASTETYFLAERSVTWVPIALSLFASNIGSEHFVGLTGAAAQDGISVGWYEVGAVPVILMLGFFFYPTYLNSGISTTPEYLEQRYTSPCKTIVVVCSLFLYVFSKIAATLYASEILLAELVNMNRVVAVILLIFGTTVYTVLGGLEAVIYTEAIQTIVLLLGSFLVLGYSLVAVNGVVGLKEELDSSFFHIFRPATDPDFPWTGFIFGFFVVAPWYWGIDQVIVQRALAGKNIAHGQLGCVGAAFLKFFTFFLMVVPGLCARVLLNRDRQVEGGEELPPINFNRAYPYLILNVAPDNSKGFIVAGMLAALMSSLASVFNSSATLFTLDVWRPLFPHHDEQKLVNVGRVSVVVLAIFAVLWLPVIPLLGKRFFLVIQFPPALVAPPIFAVFFWGMVSRYPRKQAGLWALVFGFALGLTRFLLDIVEAVSGDKMFGGFTSINFLHFAVINFAASSGVLFGLSAILNLCPPNRFLDDGTQASDFMFFQTNIFDRLMRQSDERRSLSSGLTFGDAIELPRLSSNRNSDSLRLVEGSDADLIGDDDTEDQAEEQPAAEGSSISLRERWQGKKKSKVVQFCMGKLFIRSLALTIILLWVIEVGFLA